MSVYTSAEIADKTWLILEHNFNALYYLEGDERGLLIDTGIGGSKDLKTVIDELASKPYDVVLTHGHTDHAGGIFAFDKIYFNLRDQSLLKDLGNEYRRDWIENLHKVSGGVAEDQSAENMLMATELPKMTHADSGFIFRLGGRDVVVRATPGHTEGSICLHDQKHNLLFVGDTIIYRLLLLAGASDPMQRAMRWRDQTRWVFQKLRTLQGIYMGHHGRASEELLVELPRLVDGLLAGAVSLERKGGDIFVNQGEVSVYFNLPF